MEEEKEMEMAERQRMSEDYTRYWLDCPAHRTVLYRSHSLCPYRLLYHGGR